MMGLAAALSATPAGAADRMPKTESVLIKAITDCRAISVDADRLRCFDAAAGNVAVAVAEKKVYVLDRSQVQATRRTLFGLPLPNLGIFGGENDDKDDKDVVRQIDATLRSASSDGIGNWTFVLDDGSVWRQIDGVLGTIPKRGSKVVIKRAALGSYKINVDGYSAVRVRRVS